MDTEKHYDKEYIEFHTKILELDKKVSLIENTIGWSDRLEVQFKELKKEALNLQGSEYERRLSELNHAHEKAVEERNLTLPRETFDTWLKEYEKWKAEIILQATGLFTKDMFDAWRKENDLWKNSVAPIADQKIIIQNVEKVETAIIQINSTLSTLQTVTTPVKENMKRIEAIEKTVSNWQGKITIIGLAWGVILILLNWYLKSH